MTKLGTPEHEKKLKEALADLQKQGFRALALNGKCPDGIAVKDGKLYCVEVMGKNRKKEKKYGRSYHYKTKLKLYQGLGFDGVLMFEFEYIGNPPALPLQPTSTVQKGVIS